MNTVFNFIAQQTGMEKEAIEEALKDWEANEIIADGKSIGTMIIKGTEVHMAFKPEHYRFALRRKQIQELMSPYFGRMGFLTTRILVDQVNAQDFVQRIGFKQTHTDGAFNYFLLADLPFSKART